MKSDRETAAWLDAAYVAPAGDFLEKIIRAVYSAIVRPGDLAIDCGAHKGLHTIPLSDIVGPSGRVLAVEALPDLAELLALHARSSGYTNIEVVPQAIGSREGKSTFFFVQGAPGFSGLQQRDLPPGAETTVLKIEVPVTTLDNLCATSGKHVRFVKMDLEGGEYHALQGAASLLRDHHPLVIFEDGGEPAAKLYGYTRDDWFALFKRADLVVFDLFGTPFTLAHWDCYRPWYAIAAARGSEDERFVRSDLRDLIRAAHRKLRWDLLNKRVRDQLKRARHWVAQ